MKLLFGLTFLLIVGSAEAATRHRLAGVVVDEAGRPIANARIGHFQARSTGRFYGLTAANGEFALSVDTKAVVFRKPRYQSVRLDIKDTAEAEFVRIVLPNPSPRVATLDDISECVVDVFRASENGASSTFTGIKRGNGSWLGVHAGYGRDWSWDLPDDWFVWDSTEYSETVGGDTFHIEVDARGRLAEGNYWRFRSRFRGASWYSTPDAMHQRMLDRIMAGSCREYPPGNFSSSRSPSEEAQVMIAAWHRQLAKNTASMRWRIGEALTIGWMVMFLFQWLAHRGVVEQPWPAMLSGILDLLFGRRLVSLRSFTLCALFSFFLAVHLVIKPSLTEERVYASIMGISAGIILIVPGYLSLTLSRWYLRLAACDGMTWRTCLFVPGMLISAFVVMIGTIDPALTLYFQLGKIRPFVEEPCCVTYGPSGMFFSIAKAAVDVWLLPLAAILILLVAGKLGRGLQRLQPTAPNP